jgi:adhesin transport system membrane fusion protein
MTNRAELAVQVGDLALDANQIKPRQDPFVDKRLCDRQFLVREVQIVQQLFSPGAHLGNFLLALGGQGFQDPDLGGELSTVRQTIPRLKTAAEEAEQRIEELILTKKAEVSSELNQAKAELKSVTETLFAGTDRVRRTEVRSLVRGTVKELKHNTVGGVIRPGEDIVEIVPLDDTLLIEAKIRPADIAFLRPGQEATVKITAYDFSIYGGLTAKLERISADTIRDDEDQRGERFYRAYLRTDRNTLAHHGEELPIIPGMTATVEILTGKKSVLDYVLKPILKARDRALTER